MPASFLHGVEVIEVPNGPVPVTVVKSAVIGLVGTAPSWAVESPSVAVAPNTPALVSSALDAANFGPIVQGYSIPYALAAIQAQGAGQAIVVNVFNPAIHFTAIAATAFSFNAQGAINLGHMGVSNVVVTSNPAGTTYVAGTDYTLDAVNGAITIVSAGSGGHITAGASVLIAFHYADPSKVADADIIGAVTGGVYTGMQAFQTTYGTMGFFPKILIAPGYSQDAAVATEIDAMANTIRAMALVDSPPSTAVETAIANRGVVGNAFAASSSRTILCYPQEKFYDTGIVPTGVTLNPSGTPVTAQFNANSVGPFLQWVAGAIAAKDLAQGYWWSPSNTQVDGILGPDVTLYASILDPASDTNNLNAAGIDGVQRIRHRTSGVGQPERRVPVINCAGQFHLGTPHDGHNRGSAGTRDAPVYRPADFERADHGDPRQRKRVHQIAHPARCTGSRRGKLRPGGKSIRADRRRPTGL